MRRFLKQMAFFLFPIITIGICLECLLRIIPNDYAYKSSYLNTHSREIKVLFLGSSHAFYGINPSYIQSNSFNAAYVSQSIGYDEKIIRKYEGKWDSLKYIVLPIDYFSLYGRLETGIEAWRIKKYNIYCGIHTSWKVEDNSELLGNKLKVNLSRLYQYYFKHRNPITCSEKGWGTACNHSKNQNLLKSGKEAAQRHSIKDDGLVEANIEFLKSIIAFSKSKGIRVILYTSPAYQTYIENLDSHQLNTTINEVDKLVAQSSNAYYYNIMKDSNFVETDFFDADHLNDIGAQKLTRKINYLLEELEKGHD